MVAWGLNNERGGLAVRERVRGDLSKGEEEEIAMGSDWDIRNRLWVLIREGWERLDLMSMCVYREGEREREREILNENIKKNDKTDYLNKIKVYNR